VRSSSYLSSSVKKIQTKKNATIIDEIVERNLKVRVY